MKESLVDDNSWFALARLLWYWSRIVVLFAGQGWQQQSNIPSWRARITAWLHTTLWSGTKFLDPSPWRWCTHKCIFAWIHTIVTLPAAWKVFLSDTFVAAQFVLAKTFRLMNSLTDSLHCAGVVRSRRNRVSTWVITTFTASTLASLEQHSLRLLREYHFISCLTMSIMGFSEDCSNTLLETGNNILQRLPHFKCCIFWNFKTFLSGPSHSTGLTQRVNPNLGKTFKVGKRTTPVSQYTYMSTSPPHTTIRDGWRWACRWSLVLVNAVRSWSDPHHDVLSLLFQSKHVSVGLKKRLDRAHSHRFSPHNGSIKLLHLTHLYLYCGVNLDITVHHRIHIGRSSGRNAVDCNCTRRQRQFNISLVFLRRWHIGYAFLCAATVTHLSRKVTKKIEDIVQGTHCNVFAWIRLVVRIWWSKVFSTVTVCLRMDKYMWECIQMYPDLPIPRRSVVFTWDVAVPFVNVWDAAGELTCRHWSKFSDDLGVAQSQRVSVPISSRTILGNEGIFIDLHNSSQDDENNVCLWLMRTIALLALCSVILLTCLILQSVLFQTMHSLWLKSKILAQCLVPFLCLATQKSLRWDSLCLLSSSVFVETLLVVHSLLTAPIHGTFQHHMFPSTIRNKTRGEIIRCRFRSINAHAEQIRSEFSRIGNLECLQKFDDGCYNQWKSASKWGSNSACQRIGLVRDSKAFRRYTDNSLIWKTLRRTRTFLWMDQWSETTTH